MLIVCDGDTSLFCLLGCFSFSFGVFGLMSGALSEGGMSHSLTAPASSLFFQLQPSRRSKLSSSKQCPRTRSEWGFLIKMPNVFISQASGFGFLTKDCGCESPPCMDFFPFTVFQADLPCYDSCLAKAGRLLDFLSLPNEHHLASSQKAWSGWRQYWIFQVSFI